MKKTLKTAKTTGIAIGKIREEKEADLCQKFRKDIG